MTTQTIADPVLGSTLEDRYNAWIAASRKDAGRHAAMTRKGIEWRTPIMLAGSRLRAALRTADPRAVRLLHCDLAASYLDLLPDDPRPMVILWTARRLALGLADETDRRAVLRLAFAISTHWHRYTTGQSVRERRAGWAAEVVAFTVATQPALALERVAIYLSYLADQDRAACQEDLAARVELLAQRTR